MKYLHTMIRVSDPAETIRFFELLGLKEIAPHGQREGPLHADLPRRARRRATREVELTHNWDETGYDGGRNFGHLAYRVDDIYATLPALMDAGVTINRPPRDGHMAFVRTPDDISIELLQDGKPLRARRALGVDAQHRQLVSAMPIEIVPVPALSDNYVWLMHDPDSGETVVVDPGEARAGAGRGRGARLAHHAGVEHPLAWRSCRRQCGDQGGDRRHHHRSRRRGPHPDARPVVEEGDRVRIGAHEGEVIAVGAHTAGHIAIHLPDEAVVFTGDTLFAMGCGRLFEGNAEDMFRAMCQARRSARRDTGLLRARIYRRQRALRGGDRAGQRGRPRRAGRGRAAARRGPPHAALHDRGRMCYQSLHAGQGCGGARCAPRRQGQFQGLGIVRRPCAFLA